MRNISELTVEEEGSVWEENWEQFRGVFLLLAWGLGLWGWYGFFHGRLGSAAFSIVLSLIFFALRWNASKAVRVSAESLWVGLLAAGSLFALYFYTALPSFYWGQDPSFWLAVHAGAVTEPIWSPLSYLIGEAVVFLFSSQVFSILPRLSAVVAAIALFVVAQELLAQFRSKSRANLIFVFFSCVVLGLSRPFWNAATMGLGLVSSLGLLLFLLFRHSLQLEKGYATVSYFLLGLLWSAHPMWGIVGLLFFLTGKPKAVEVRKNILPLFLGLSPYLWIVARREKFFPSWGGADPFIEAVKEGRQLWAGHFLNDWSWLGAVQAWGWEIAALLVWALAMALFNLLKGLEFPKRAVSMVDFWLWLLCGIGALFFYSNGTDHLGVTSLWFATGTVGFLAFSFDRRAGSVWGIDFKKVLEITSILGILIVGGLSWLPEQSYFRNQTFFPQQHALNLTRGLGSRTVLVCDDPFEFNGCLEALWMEPAGPTAFVLDKNNLDKRWYVAQWIDREPDFFFSTITGPTDLILKSVVLNNRDNWQIQWSRAELPKDWQEPSASRAVLTQLFQSEANPVDPSQFQYRYDLSSVTVNRPDLDSRSRRYLSRYTAGFKLMGDQLMTQQRYTEAIHAYDRAAKLDPLDQSAMAVLSQIYSQHNILEAAQLDYEAVVKSHPQQIDQVMKSLDEAQSRKDETKAADDLGQLVKLNTELAEAQYQLSKIYGQQGRTQEANALLEASVQVDPKQVEAQMALGHFLEKTGEWDKAEEAFRSVLTVDSQNKEAQVELWKLLNKPKS